MRTAATLAATVAAIFLLLPLFVLGISWMLRAAVSTAVLAIVLRTAVAAAVATTIDMVFGIAMGYRLSRDPEFRRRPLRMLLQIPGHVPQAAVGLALVMAYGGCREVGLPGPATPSSSRRWYSSASRLRWKNVGEDSMPLIFIWRGFPGPWEPGRAKPFDR